MERREFIKIGSVAFLGLSFYACSPYRNVQLISNYVDKKSNRNITIGIIGSGITGLVSAALLAKFGYRVLVFESNPDYFGGHARILNINNNKYSAGPQYLWNFGNGEIGNRVLTYLGIEDEIQFKLMNSNSFENYLIGKKEKISIPMGIKKFKNKLIKLIPQEKKEITDFFYYFNHLFEAIKFLHNEGLFIEDYSSMKLKLLETTHINTKSKLIAKKMGKWSLGDLFDYCNLSQNTRRLLYGSGGIFAENESDISLGLYIAGMGYFHNGAYIPKKGFGSLINGLVKSIQINGGNLFLNNEIVKINSKNKNVISLTNSRDENYPVDIVISNISPHLTCDLLDSCKKKSLNYQPSNSYTSCFIELDNYGNINKELKGKNFWWQFGNNEVNYLNPNMLKEPEMIYIGSPSANKSKLSKELLILYTPGSFEQSKSYFEKGEIEYEKFKNNVWNLILNKLDDNIFPNIKRSIKSVTIHTPYDLYAQINAERGSVYGRRGDFENISSAIYDISDIKNLYLANATIGSPGIAAGFQLSSVLFAKLTDHKI